MSRVTVLLVLLLAGCGLKSPQAVMDSVEEVNHQTVAGDLDSVFHTALTSQYATNQHIHHSKTEDAGLIWMGGYNDIYAVVEFKRKSASQTRVSYYYHAGNWDKNLRGIRRVLKREYNP